MTSIAKAIPQDAVQERVSHIAGTRIFTVLSRTTNGKEYTVTVNETVRCTCPCARKACWHKQQVGAYMLAQEEARIQAEEDAKLQAAVGAWWQAQYGNLTAQEVLDAEAEREEAAFWQDFNASRETIISAVNVRIDSYLSKTPLCKACERRPAGPRGLCYRCEEQQRQAETRKAQACTRSSRWNDERVFDPISGWKSAS